MSAEVYECTENENKKRAMVCWVDKWMPKNAHHILEQTGLRILTPKKPVGCGVFGCVFLTDDPRWVVKVSYDKTEAPLMQKVLDLRKKETGVAFGPSRVLPGIVFVKALFRGRQILHGRHYITPYVIVRENVSPATDEDVKDMEWYSDSRIEGGEITPGLDMVMKWAEKFHEYKRFPEETSEAMKHFVEWLVRVERDYPLVIGDMMTLFREHDLVLQDVHSYNVGRSIVDWGKDYRRPGQWVVHDLGVTPTSSRKDFRILNPVRVNMIG